MKKKLTVKDKAMELSLPKWPTLLVSGNRVSADIAAEILIRTDCSLPDYSYALNDRDFAYEIMDLFGIDSSDNAASVNDTGHIMDYYRRINLLRDRMNKLPLNYLYNSRIGSSYICGPHGWCDWDGNIFCNSYNIGKHPSVDAVANDWMEIASAFPMLKLRSQLLSEETTQADDSVPLVEFIIENGTVTVRKPVSKMLPVVIDVFSSMMNLGYADRERGITISILRQKLEQVYGEIPQYE